MIEYPTTSEEFYNDYKDHVYDWLKIKRFDLIDPDEFFSSFIQRLIEKQILDKFDPSKKVQFKTWLNRVLSNFYYTLIKKESKRKWISIDESEFDNDKQENRGIELVSPSADHLDNIISETQLAQLLRIIDSIDKVRDRVLIKLKFLSPGYDIINLNEDDLEFIEQTGGLSKNEIKDFLDLHIKGDIGLKEKHIGVLINMPIGSVGTNFQRAVSKWLK